MVRDVRALGDVKLERDTGEKSTYDDTERHRAGSSDLGSKMEVRRGPRLTPGHHQHREAKKMRKNQQKLFDSVTLFRRDC